MPGSGETPARFCSRCKGDEGYPDSSAPKTREAPVDALVTSGRSANSIGHWTYASENPAAKPHLENDLRLLVLAKMSRSPSFLG